MRPAPTLYDTLGRAPRALVPLDGATLRFYACGPTVYGPAHIGNFRTFLCQDILRRVVELCGWRTLHVRNLTDVDDKTIRESVRLGVELSDFTAGWTKIFHDDCAALNLLPPHQEPGAVAHIPVQIDMIRRLVDKGNAYVGSDGSVYFSLASFPNYGELSRLKERELKPGATVADVDEYDKDSAADFVLWKKRKPEDGPNHWPSPWGEGRPGWHLECSAMIETFLGPDFDLHSGGVDLVFPHHENEIAQSQCSCGGHFAAHWFHIAHLMVDGGKMSKSLGNLHTVSDLTRTGHGLAAVRYALISGHYRRPLNFRLQSLDDASQALQKLAKADATLAETQGGADAPTYEQMLATAREATIDPGPFAQAWQALLNDLNVPEALGHVFSKLRDAVRAADTPEKAGATRQGLHLILHALGLNLPLADSSSVDAPEEVSSLAQARWQAKKDKNWAESDKIRAKLEELGWKVKDNRDGFDLAPL